MFFIKITTCLNKIVGNVILFKYFLLRRPNGILTEDYWGDDINIAAFSNFVKFISFLFLARSK
jgi:hypothetical protein